MEQGSEGFFEKLQSLPEPTKKKVLIIATAIIMVIVIYFWLAYFNNLLASVAQPVMTVENGAVNGAAAQTSTTSAPSGSQIGFFARLENGFGYLGVQFMNFAHGLGAILKAPRQYIVQPQR